MGGFDAPTLPRVPSVPMPALPSVNMTMPSMALPSMAMPSMHMTMPTMSLPSLPGIPGLSSSPASAGEKGLAGSPARGGGWGMRNVSWGTDWLKKGHKRSSSSLAGVAKGDVSGMVDGAAEGEAVSAQQNGTDATEEQADGGGGGAAGDPRPAASNGVPTSGTEETTLAPPDASVSNSVTPGSGARSPATPAVKLAVDDVDPIALAEAMASMEALTGVEAVGDEVAHESSESAAAGLVENGDAVGRAQPAEPLPPPGPVRLVSEVFVGGGDERDTKAEVWSYQVSSAD